jgi:hypothetical protein
MSFDWALSQLRSGKAVYRLRWMPGWSSLRPYIRYAEYGNGREIWESVFGNVNLKPDDLEADDWVEYKPSSPGQPESPEPDKLEVPCG